MNRSLYVGMDASKGYADFLPLRADQTPQEDSFRLDDTAEGYSQFRQLIQSWLDQGYQQIYCGIESTGGYENNWVNLLLGWSQQLPVHITRLNPSGVTSLRKAGLVRTSTDAVSAEYIALYLIVMAKKVVWLTPQQAPGNDFAAARKYQRSIAMLDKQCQQLGSQLEKLLYQYFSPWLLYTRRGIPAWLLEILSRYPTPKRVKRAGPGRLNSIKAISADKAETLVKKLSGQWPEPGLLDAENIKETARQILHLRRLIADRHKLLQSQFKEDWQVKLLMSMPGVGLQTAVLLRVEIEDISRFSSAKKLATYFGLSPKFVESGDKKGQIRMSKQGRPEVRKALYMSGLTAIRRDTGIKKRYHRYRSKGYNHFQAMGVVMHKLLRMVYGILKSGISYDPRIDQRNQELSEAKQTKLNEMEIRIQKKKKKKLHRYQNESLTAPRSRRSAQKIKKQMASQSSTVEERAGLPIAPTKKENL